MFSHTCRWLPAIGFAVCLGSLYGENRAAASCGDYVHIVPPSVNVQSGTPDHPTTPMPCHGPSCRKPAGPPVHAPVSPPPTTTYHGDALLTTEPDPDAANSAALTPHTDWPTDGPVSVIFVPPRP